MPGWIERFERFVPVSVRRLALTCLVCAATIAIGCGLGGEVSPAAGDEPAATSPEPTDSATESAADPSDPEGSAAETAEPEDDPMSESPFPHRIPAPSLSGGTAWLNTAGPLDLKDLRGKFVLLDFCTYCCINCMHILPELKKLERAYPGEIVVIGVHSAKFDTEQDSKNIAEAVLRYEIEHPVVNDANHTIWNKFQISSWPSLRIIDPEGYLVAGHSGELEFEDLDRFFRGAIPHYQKAGLLDPTPLRFDLERYRADATPLRFPGKVLADEPGNRLFIADSNHNRLVVTRLDGTLLDTIGNGAIGATDGDSATATWNHPQGMALRDGRWLYVADTENHLLRKVDLQTRQVTTIAGTGVQGRFAWPGLDPAQFRGAGALPERFVGPPRETALNSPWDLWIEGDQLYIAMAGPHQIWKLPLDETEIGPYAGNGREDIVDGPLLPREPYEMGFASFAQPSGLASDGHALFVADSEGSSIRAVPFDPAGEVTTVVGTSHLPGGRLFTFGDQDGQGNDVLLQHALGVVFYRDQLYVADTYNNKLKVLDPKTRQVTTLAGTGQPGNAEHPAQFDEPAGITAAAGKLYVADTNNHAIRVIDLARPEQATTLTIAGLEPPASSAASLADSLELAPAESPVAARVAARDGRLVFRVHLELPTGWKLNPLAPLGYRLEVLGPAGPVDTAKLPAERVRVEPPATTFDVPLALTGASGSSELRLTVNYYFCREGRDGVCKMGSVAWPVSLTLAADGSAEPVELEHVVDASPGGGG